MRSAYFLLILLIKENDEIIKYASTTIIEYSRANKLPTKGNIV